MERKMIPFILFVIANPKYPENTKPRRTVSPAKTLRNKGRRYSLIKISRYLSLKYLTDITNTYTDEKTVASEFP